MSARSVDAVLNGLIEKLAAIEHDRWAHWQSYMHGMATRNPDGSISISAELVAKWESQIARSYADLSEREKASDREQVNKYLPIIAQALKAD